MRLATARRMAKTAASADVPAQEAIDSCQHRSDLRLAGVIGTGASGPAPLARAESSAE